MAAVVLAALALSLGPLGTPSSPAGTPLPPDRLRQEATGALESTRAVSVHVRVREGRHTVEASAGEAALGTGRPVPNGAHFRAASVTKSFVAATVLQLAAERRLSPHDTVERWLPGLVQGHGNDGSRITIRHLLQHTSGLHDYDSTELTGRTAPEFERRRFDHIATERLVAAALRHAPDFPPADPADPEPRWNYSNTGYHLLGAVIEKVTGRPWAEEVEDRIVRRLGLRGTRVPGDDPSLPKPYAHTYHRFAGSARYTDTTVRNMAWAGTAGALVSTSRDLDRFFTALLTGELLPPRELAAMRTTVPSNEEHQRFTPGLRYGLGLMRQPLPCGGSRWGHHGDLEGTFVRTGFTADGRRSVVVTVNGRTTDDTQLLTAEKALQGLIDRMLCRR
ncbi:MULTISPECIES: serine hydrolase [Streptomyces]|uniref:Beta-lactamase family protein n=1 Tax=Streptomyces koelreuteriae TaxID=2838015 RepID=A0ABX8FWZ2_9ACTN|nr:MULTISPECIES: serine hydrolase domain-containing protein [Streptomyces]QWB25753.1 beta-lactamase family protein [Streptomyces koelreuteriae]UUA08812.1 beta-lactamase family protein [Streptomyces koelreuteriae]UUA16417.1 beta-lactamase family protein [Streptomyces sp. CRCS-T-1]